MNILDSVDNILQNIASINADYSADIINARKYQYAFNRQLQELAENPYFKHFHGEPDISLRLPNYIQSQEKILIDRPIAFSPIIDERRFYLRLHPTEQTLSNSFLHIPNRDYLVSSYEWQNLFSISGILEHRSMLKFKNFKHCDDIDICFFGVSSKNKSYACTYRINCLISELFDIISSPNLKTICDENNYFYMAIKRLKPIPRQENLHLCKSLSPKRKDPKTYIIFIDSLDQSVFTDPDLMKLTPNLNKFANKSTLFKGFTSIADWTFPCLHSIYTAVPPYFSFSNYRHPAYTRFIRLQDIPANCNFWLYFVFKSIHAPDSKLNRDNFLTSLIESYGRSSVGIKNSNNHCHFHGLMHSMDYSLDASSHRVGNALDLLKEALGPFDPDNIFIDIDTLHRGDLFPITGAIQFETSPFHWVSDISTKFERLTSQSKNWDLDLSRYKDKLKIVDANFGEIFNAADEEDNIIIFSDHGSHYIDIDCHPYEVDKDSTLTPKRIWKPSLLVKTSGQKSSSISDDLVSTIDIYAIIAFFNGYDIQHNDIHGPMLPKEFGGKYPRS